MPLVANRGLKNYPKIRKNKSQNSIHKNMTIYYVHYFREEYEVILEPKDNKAVNLS